ncbi:hypothetical protein BKA62DRAFT_766009 [Auriculariales sp. MPI-PUGE-AT-0066]|nr:hypothetical protein BKA62DRAFT_766009 [Auriculariales sp. MPI-PUGE-AT-0066]
MPAPRLISQQRLQPFVLLPAPQNSNRSKYAPALGVLIKREEEDDVVFLKIVKPPRKKARIEHMAHDVDTLDEVQVKLESTALDLSLRAHSFDKKVKKNQGIDEETIRDRIVSIPLSSFTTSLSQAEQMHTVSRSLICKHYRGGHAQWTYFEMSRPGGVIPTPTEILCANRTMNPYIPTNPGNNGLMLDSDVAEPVEQLDVDADDDESKPKDLDGDITTTKRGTASDTSTGDDFNPPLRELVVMSHVSPSHWRYIGHYHTVKVKPFSKAEWARQSDKFKNKWVKEIIKHGGSESMRRQVWQRKQLQERLQRDPSKEELRKALGLLSSKRKTNISFDDMMQAYNDGFLVITVRALRFVKYLDNFQRELIRFDVNPDPLPRPPKNRKRRSGDPPQRSSPKQEPKVFTGVKRKRSKSSDSEDYESEPDNSQPSPRRSQRRVKQETQHGVDEINVSSDESDDDGPDANSDFDYTDN